VPQASRQTCGNSCKATIEARKALAEAQGRDRITAEVAALVAEKSKLPPVASPDTGRQFLATLAGAVRFVSHDAIPATSDGLLYFRTLGLLLLTNFAGVVFSLGKGMLREVV
jgi:hypothetical protein